jgi:hypothetical protein
MKLTFLLLFTLAAAVTCSAQSIVQIQQKKVPITRAQINQHYMEVPITWSPVISGTYYVLLSFSYPAANTGPRNCLADAGYRDLGPSNVTQVLDVCTGAHTTDNVVVTAFAVQ